MMISLLVAMDEERGIGKNNRLPWHISSDLKRFKTLTMGHHIIMGRKTFESIGRELPGRRMVVVTGNPDYRIDAAGDQTGQLTIVHSIDKAITYAHETGENEVFIIGGGELFKQTLLLADRIYLTQVLARLDCDTFFPELNPDQWEIREEVYIPADEKNEFASRYQVLFRK